MSDLPAAMLRAVIEASGDPVIVVASGRSEWPVCYGNPAFAGIAGDLPLEGPLADFCEALLGRDAALDVSEALRSGEATRIPVDLGGRARILCVTPLDLEDGGFTAIFLRDIGGAGVSPADEEMAQALLKAKRRARDLVRDDPVTGLLNERAFRDLLAHDWAVAAREKSTLVLVRFTIVDFEAYLQVFGRHAGDSCLRRVGQAIRRCLRRASDVVARIDDASFIVLSHASEESGVRRFAGSIAATVRNLGIHHPHSSEDKFVTVEQRLVSTETGQFSQSAEAFLNAVLE